MITLTEGWKFYIENWVIPQKCDLQRTREIAKWSIATFGPRTMIEALTVEQLEASMDALTLAGKASGTRRRRLTIHYAMCNFNVKKKRVREFAKIMLPAASPPVQRSFEEEEVARLFAEPMPYRIRLFFVLDFETAARSKALEQLTFGRCDFARRVVDYRLPGVNHKNKRRPVAPINSRLYPRLVAAKARHEASGTADPRVVGVTACWQGCKADMVAAGIDERGVCRHVARHTFCSLRVQAGFSYAHIGKLVGDTSSMVERVYGHMSPEHLVAASELDVSTLRVAA